MPAAAGLLRLAVGGLLMLVVGGLLMLAVGGQLMLGLLGRLDGHPGVGDAKGEVIAVFRVIVEVDATA
jgi:hypothetical protein